MKQTAKILTVLAIIFFFAGNIEAADDSGDNIVRLANIVPRQHRRFVPPINIPPSSNKPHKEYFSRRPVRPTPRYIPSKPKPSRDNRGGRIKPFGSPRR